MIFTFILLLFLIVSCIFLEEYLGVYRKYVYGAICVVFILFSGFRPIGVDPDSEAYESIFMSNSGSSKMLIEHSFLMIVQFFRTFSDDVHVMFLFYAILGIGIKFYALRRLSPWYCLPLVIYF